MTDTYGGKMTSLTREEWQVFVRSQESNVGTPDLLELS